jgi:hypothetical protein
MTIDTYETMCFWDNDDLLKMVQDEEVLDEWYFTAFEILRQRGVFQ